MRMMLLWFGIYGFFALLCLLAIGAQSRSVRRFGAPLLLPVALGSVMLGFFWVWIFGAMRKFFWEPFNNAPMETEQLKGPDLWFATALDYISEPGKALKA